MFSRRQSFEDRDPDVVTSELFDRASDELRADVVDLIQEAFDVCAVVPPSQLARKQRSVPPTSSKQNSPKFERGHQPTHPSFFMSNNAEKGVPFDLVPDLLESLGCPSNPDMVSDVVIYFLLSLCSPVCFSTTSLHRRATCSSVPACHCLDCLRCCLSDFANSALQSMRLASPRLASPCVFCCCIAPRGDFCAIGNRVPSPQRRVSRAR